MAVGGRIKGEVFLKKRIDILIYLLYIKVIIWNWEAAYGWPFPDKEVTICLYTLSVRIRAFLL